ncbi:MAG TPA: ribose-phosphate pyrophosphokinase [Patescibacteria group bacterium]
MKLISGSSNSILAKKLAETLKIEQLNVEISRFSNGEKRVWINADQSKVKGQNIILVQSFTQPVDEHVMEFLLLVDALERLGARHINAIIPWLGYSIQDKVFREGEPLSAKVVANLISNSYIKRTFLLDLHNSSIPGFFSRPTHHLSAINLFAEYSKQKFDTGEVVVTSPDFGGLKRARQFAQLLDVPLSNIDKNRDLKTGEVTAIGLHGDVKDKKVLVFDDFINSGSTVIETDRILKEHGAKSVHFFATHGLFVNNAFETLNKADLDEIIITDSVYHQDLPNYITPLSTAKLFADELSDWM